MTYKSAAPASSPVTVLAFDSSTAVFAAAVLRNGAVEASSQLFTERNHSVHVVAEMKRLLEQCGLKPENVDVVAVGQGPGSYTGVRIAVTAGKTLAWTWNKPLIGVSSLEALALGAWQSSDKPGGKVWVVPVMDARRGQVYTSRYTADSAGHWQTLDADEIRMAAEWALLLRNEAATLGDVSEIWFVGDTTVHELALVSTDTAGGVPVRAIPFAMEAGAVGSLAMLRHGRGEKDDVHTFVPNYTQLAEAEAKLQAAARRE
ncbi:tRNA (adenosine(37)-N6)-threonylcarbamoyltransferase complex dimerization subunit type 1 TsaB [Cohnella pontilimi]|uniref:tRNA (Adenosine(37)-N6)-threonylcarbamoyltransferase complex dimerization subunit type 1 TsaB n=1 Tax=Cohnella pontilimi TaxID=2564100 RepID=A0A4U0FD36_9BACL|nr:tRNA (adenosine(37)-N6)-threonylcarbamoyltransferase complex dimerization subunit type 1 TsaB [Cohnella pontilimi]TJY42725.1 tRNA (adenosine(37)-N6)-threonylcarbamoyltransferase complex dimerization subunit type 1 TsaB [Cohnella pontilimi]